MSTLSQSGRFLLLSCYPFSMIFLDESGKRWRNIKRGIGLLGSVLAIPVLVLVAASLAYLPNWGDVPLPLSTNGANKASSTKPSSGTVEATSTTAPISKSSKPTGGNNQIPAGSTASSQVITDPGTQTLISSQPSSQTTTPPTQSQNPSGQPTDPGNSDYGHSHQPTRS